VTLNPRMNLDSKSLSLYSDEALLVINKPAGLRVLPDGYEPSAPHVRSLLEPDFGRLWIVHRLDKDTSGVLALARSAEAHRALNDQFAAHQVVKRYHALVPGAPQWEQHSVRLPLRADGDRQHRTVVDHRRGKPAITHLRLLERLPGHTLLEARPETGRTHQIRAHLAALGLPVAADHLYGSRQPLLISSFVPDFQPGSHSERPFLERLGLHAFQLEFLHPLNGDPMRFEAPYPDDLASALRVLRKVR
jgi:RluA family pseudouridine synthase